jgi:hypothetical protein
VVKLIGGGSVINGAYPVEFFWQIFFILMLKIEYAFVFKDFLLLHKLKKGRQPHLCQLLAYTLD